MAPDLAVIGAGSAGFAAAIRAAELGAAVTLIGGGKLGGTCVNVGCIPSKTVIRAVEIMHQSHAASRFSGVLASARIADWSAIAAQKDELVERLRQAKYADVLAQYDAIEYVQGNARLTPNGLAIGDMHLAPHHIVIATGASATRPAIAGLDEIPWLTSTTALELEELPESLLVVGGGAVGCEMAQLFSRAGVKVTLVCRSRLLPHGDDEVSFALAGYLRDEGIEVRCGMTYERFRRDGRGATLEMRSADGPGSVTASRVLIATGRTPNTHGLDLDRAGIAHTATGIRVDEHLRTTRPGTYAAGDVTGRDMFVYMAAYGGKIAAENALRGDAQRYDASAMPEVVFTDPQAASVGLTLEAALASGIDAHAATLALDQVPRALAARDTRGFVKLVAERESGRLLGAHILAPEGGESIQTAVLAIKHKLTVDDLTQMIFPYLTTVEGLKLAALSFSKNVDMLSCCAG